MDDLKINENLSIPGAEFELLFSRSSGPGGQNVNKVNSKVTLSWNVATTQSLYPMALARLRALASSRITADGILQISSQVHREQHRNIEACRDLLKALIVQSLHPPKTRRPTKPTAGSQRRRMDAKRIQGQKKQNRNTGSWD